MYLEVADIFWASVALFMSTTLVITTAVKNWKLTERLSEWKSYAHSLEEIQQ